MAGPNTDWWASPDSEATRSRLVENNRDPILREQRQAAMRMRYQDPEFAAMMRAKPRSGRPPRQGPRTFRWRSDAGTISEPWRPTGGNAY